jgi:hypothetical protein
MLLPLFQRLEALNFAILGEFTQVAALRGSLA